MKSAARLHLAESPFSRATDTRVRRAVEAGNALLNGDRVLIAISGGQDSCAMLLILSRLALQVGVTLSAAHFDHQLRDPAESAADERFVADLCAAAGTPLACGAGDVARRVRDCKETVEEAARTLRYAFLGEQAEATGADVVAVGHTRDDRAETVLMNILRGSGLDGLAVMDMRDPWPFGSGPEIVRPLIELSREETRRYCLESGVHPRDDATNELLIATRNRIRHELLPALREINPRVDEALCRLAEAAGMDADYMRSATEAAWTSAAHLADGEVSFDRPGFQALHAAVAARLVRRAVLHLGGPPPAHERVKQVLGAVAKGAGKIEIGGGIEAIASHTRLTLRVGGATRP